MPVYVAQESVGAFAHSTIPRLLWLNLVVLAAAFFCMDHAYGISAERQSVLEQPAEVGELVENDSPYRNVGYVLMAASAVHVWLLRPRHKTIGFSLGLWFLCGYLLWCAASFTWSDDPPTSARRLVALALLALTALGWARHLMPSNVWIIGLVIPAVHLAAGIIAELDAGTLRPWQSDYRFMGTTHPNVQGLQLALLLSSLQTARSLGRVSRKVAWPLAALALLVLILTRSRTALLAWLASLLLVGLPYCRPMVQALVGLGCPFAASLFLLAGSLFYSRLFQLFGGMLLMGRTEETGTLTGRLPLWNELYWYIREQPLAGYGYGAFWTRQRMLKISESQDWVIAHAHNAFLELVLNTGIVGLGLAVSALLCTWVPAWIRYYRTRDAAWQFACGVSAIAAIFSMTEGVFAQHGYAMFCLLTTMGALLLHPAHNDGLAAR
ncbi:MAG: ligase [Pirellulaceae bacterium]|nr:MAG: ligase [Pirellulaceae bacterium]